MTSRAGASDRPLVSDELFTTATVAGLELKSRFVMAPMTRRRSPGGVPTAAVAEYYARRAAHGVGLIITEGIYLDHPSAGHEPNIPRLQDAASTAGWRRVVDRVHHAGGRIAAQLWHLGGKRRPVDAYGTWTPSGVGSDGSASGQPLTVNQISSLIAAYGRTAAVAADVGFDAIEIHGAHGYLIDEFLWPRTNRRSDRYGGSARNRARLAAEIVAGTRLAVGPRMPIIFRFSQFKERDYDARIAQTPEALGEILTQLKDAGTNILHASARRFWQAAFAGSDLSLAGWAKRLSDLPTVTVGSVGLTRKFFRPAPGQPGCRELSRRFAANEFDLVALGRALISNPDWVHRVSRGDFEVRDYDAADLDRLD
jgi:2,4-dienoyl-CoA reductase-like NADH-dependent reductase (Old Yellow Enzyme family)